MSFQIRTEDRPAVGPDGRFYIVEDKQRQVGMEVWPALGFNCVRWFSPCGGRVTEWLYSTPQLLQENKPTRSGIPVLFPFPNRIRAGRFSWDGKDYQLAINDPENANAIHGFACQHPWRIVDQASLTDSAWITGEFWVSRDAPEALKLWPTDYRLRVTYRLAAGSLRIEAHVFNPDKKPLPFGLGYHPYFRLPGGADGTLIQAEARQMWELQNSLPTGQRLPVDGRTDLRHPRKYAELSLDDLLTDLSGAEVEVSHLRHVGSVRTAAGPARLDVLASPHFRDMVVFTPPHREGVCLEPYTCPTDAINLQARGTDAGWLTLAPGAEWSADVELRVPMG